MGRLSGGDAVTRYLYAHEFACPCCSENFTDIRLVDRLNTSRDLAGIPFVINSGYRCEAHNAAVGGSKTSSHVKGLAADIAVKNSHSRYVMLRALMDTGFNRIGVYKTFIHADIDESKTQQVIWHG